MSKSTSRCSRELETVTRSEAILEANLSRRSLDPEVAKWLGEVPDVLAKRLAAVGLIAPRESQREQSLLLGSFLTNYIATRSDVKPATHRKYATTRRYLLEFFGESRPLRSITAGDADEFRLKLVERKVSENTVRKHVAVSKVFFMAGVRKELIPSNPFARLKSAIQPNPDRFRFVTRAEIQQVTDACPDAQWRLIVALSRYGGLRCPSEHLALKWGHVDWARGRINVPSPKTAHHVGKSTRTIPLFPELRQPLTEVFEQTEPGTEFVITRYRDSNVNLRTQLLRIIQKAGLTAWPKLFQNLRSTRETELAETFPLHVVVAWLGNSEPVARKHYLQLTEAHFDKATHNQTHSGAEIGEMEGNGAIHPPTNNEKGPEFPGLSVPCRDMHNLTVAARGLEPRRLAAQDPKSCVSANFTKRPFRNHRCEVKLYSVADFRATLMATP